MTHKDIVNIHLENRYAATWQKYGDERIQTCIRGTSFFGNTFCRGMKQFDLFSRFYTDLKNEKFENLIHFLNQLNGFFAVIIQNDQTVFAAVDRVRSMPLFYGEAYGQVFLSDNAEWVRKSVGDKKMDPMALQEFLHTGYVTGPETLFPHVKQLQAGEILYITKDLKGLNLKTYRYYRYLHNESNELVDEKALLTELDVVSERIMKRLVEYADGRQIIAPLSAGYDSRLIVTLLRKLGYNNVLTFSYGMLGNRESQVSHSIATSLDYDWEFVPYSNRLWRQWWNSQERRDYQRWASGWTSVSHNQDWPAVWRLKLTGKLAEDAVFIPGHSADLLAGSRSKIMRELYNPCLTQPLQGVDAILRYHYIFKSVKRKDFALYHSFKKRILENLSPITDFPNPASSFESWDVAERQAKFIINSVRVYEFWGYDWYLPFWDKDFMHFWQKVPLSLRINKIPYDKFVNLAYAEQCNRLNNKPFVSKTIKTEHLNATLTVLKSIPLMKKIINWIIRPLRMIHNYYKNPLALYGRYSIKDYISLSIRGFDGHRMLSQISIKELKKHVKN